jgi:23S rRNA (cytidine1920-2'-O)/16S rRNA (cytidine1409-2'-O)-methyltransferase
MKKRLDILIVEKGLASSRTRAQDLIKAGLVQVVSTQGPRIGDAPGETFPEATEIRVLENDIEKYVSRGGLKLEGALKHTGIRCEDVVALDVGQSTGGFTHCLLEQGARRVIGVDVGHGQLHDRLRNHERVVSLEGINAKELDQDARLLSYRPPSGFEFIVVDLSFISLTLVLESLARCLAPHGQLLALVKPQFEVGPAHLAKGGVVKDFSLFHEVEGKIKAKAKAAGLTVLDYFPSSIEGKDGNKEFFIHARL